MEDNSMEKWGEIQWKGEKYNDKWGKIQWIRKKYNKTEEDLKVLLQAGNIQIVHI